MKLSHVIVLVLAFYFGLILSAKVPGLTNKATLGMVS